MKQNYIKPETKIFELHTFDIMFMRESGQIDEGRAKAHSYIDDEEDWSDFEDNDFQK